MFVRSMKQWGEHLYMDWPISRSRNPLYTEKEKKNFGSGGIRTHASMRLVPKTSALDRSATLPHGRLVLPRSTGSE